MLSQNEDFSPAAGDSPAASPQPWEFAGWGTAERIEDLSTRPLRPLDSAPTSHQLGAWKATAICGNDITSSCLYVSALCVLHAGKLAPIALAVVAALLYVFRKIYGEVGSALPLNGGAYNVLLNTTSKSRAAIAACLTVLSYVATAVISANEAMHYAHNLWPGLDVFSATIALLGLFALLNLIGITESATVALVIFIFHLFTLSALVVLASAHVIGDSGTFALNWSQPAPGGMFRALYLGFSAALLGISGFESSANFIEEQRPGVFLKTLRNMWLAVAFFNPVISLLSLGVLPLTEIAEHKEDLLAFMGLRLQGPWLQTWVSLNAVCVLSGAVLTSYVGVTGLVRRMSLDRCLPQILLRENRWRRTNHYIIVGFFLLCCSILAITHGRVDVLAGVYTISFLGVMALFAVGNMLLKVRRAPLPRDVRASWPGVVLAFLGVCAGILGNIVLNPAYVKIFSAYFIATLAVVAVMFLRIELLKVVLFISRAVVERVQAMNSWMRQHILRKIDDIASLSVIYFTRGDDLASLNRAAQYVLQNEQTRRLIVVHVYQKDQDIPDELASHLSTIDHVYPQLRIDFLAVKGTFGPELIEALAQRLGVAKNYMFISTPGNHFPHRLSELGGVRVVM